MDSLELKSFFTVHRTAGKQTHRVHRHTMPHRIPFPLGRLSTGFVVDDVERSSVTLEAQGLSVFRGCATTLENNDGSFP